MGCIDRLGWAWGTFTFSLIKIATAYKRKAFLYPFPRQSPRKWFSQGFLLQWNCRRQPIKGMLPLAPRKKERQDERWPGSLNWLFYSWPQIYSRLQKQKGRQFRRLVGHMTKELLTKAANLNHFLFFMLERTLEASGPLAALPTLAPVSFEALVLTHPNFKIWFSLWALCGLLRSNERFQPLIFKLAVPMNQAQDGRSSGY